MTDRTNQPSASRLHDDAYIEAEIQRLQKEIYLNDKKLVDKMIKSSRTRTVLNPVPSESNYMRSPHSNGSSPKGPAPINIEVQDENVMTFKQSPSPHNLHNQSSFIQQNPRGIDEIRQELKKIFTFYVSFGDRLNSTSLKANKLHKMLHDAFLYDENITKKKIDILFCKISKNLPSINFESFLTLLLNIAVKKYPDVEQRQAFIELFSNYLKPLYENIYKETDLGDFDFICKQDLDDDVILIMTAISPVFAKLHKFYFDSEYQRYERKFIRQKSETGILTLLKEFDVCPTLINVSLAFQLFQDVMEASKQALQCNSNLPFKLPREEGKEFTLTRFIVFITRLALLITSQINGDNNPEALYSQSDKLMNLLERMEFSPGFVNFEKRMNTTNNSSISLFPPKDIMAKIRQINQGSNPENQSVVDDQLTSDRHGMSVIQEVSTSRSRSRLMSPGLRATTGRTTSSFIGTTTRSKTPGALNKTLGSSSFYQIDFRPQVAAVFEKHKEDLQRLFKSYCSFASNSNVYKMKTIKLMKMLKDARLMQETDSDALNRSTRSRLRDESPVANLKNSIRDMVASKRMLDPKEVDLFVIKIVAPVLRKSVSSRSKNFEIVSPGRKIEEEMNQFQGKLDYNQFLKVLEFAAFKVYPELDEDIAVQYILEKNLSGLLGAKSKTIEQIDSKEHLKRLMEILKEESVIDILGKLKKSMHGYYAYYTEENITMTFDNFLRFCKDFEIFPQLIPRARLQQIFNNLATLLPLLAKDKSNNPINLQNLGGEELENPLIDENLFVEAVALCASEIEDGIAAHIVEKIVYLLEKMGEAAGPKSIKNGFRVTTRIMDPQKATWEIISYIKGKYANLANFNRSMVVEKKSNLSFAELFPKKR